MQATSLLRTKRSTLASLAAVLAGITLGLLIGASPATLAVAAPELQPKTTHPVQGRENCLACHQSGGGVKASPSNHASYTNATCLGCHPAAASPAQPAPPAPPSQPTMARPQPSPTAPLEQTEAAEPTRTPEPTAAAPGGPSPTAEVPGPTAPPPATQSTNATADSAKAAPSPGCLDCHRNQALSMELSSGEKLSLFVDEGEMSKSVHGDKLGCSDCHSRITGFPHKKLQVASRREYSMAQYETCKRCHFANYSKTLDSMHYQVMEAGNQNAPLCTDCHGYHNVSRPGEPRSKISLSCSKCHNSTYQTYASSVHGAALVKDENGDVPVCTDCHGTHTIVDAASARFRLASPEMCARCHADETLMRKYNLSPNVFKTYVQDFHGATVALTKRQGPDNWTDKAVCSDCHGVHNIQSTKGSSPAEIKRNMVSTCRKCHPDASDSFPDAWLSHYELSIENAPLPWLVRSWYVIMIPIMVGGLMLHIVVDLWRIARNR